MQVSEIYSEAGWILQKRNPSAGALGFWGRSAEDAGVQQVGQIGTEHLRKDVSDGDRQDDDEQNSEH